jgi:hypothetical protein
LIVEKTRMEAPHAQGRADLVAIFPDTVYIFELKMMGSGTAEDALRQIEEKGYATPYLAGTRKIVKVGAEFSEKERTVTRWLIA